jgi:hypothetical protein
MSMDKGAGRSRLGVPDRGKHDASMLGRDNRGLAMPGLEGYTF